MQEICHIMLMEMISVSEFLQPLEIMVFLVASDLCRPPARHLPAIALAQARPPARRAYASESGWAWIAGPTRMFLFKNQGTGFSTGQ
jgi:hypothetical protein